MNSNTLFLVSFAFYRNLYFIVVISKHFRLNHQSCIFENGFLKIVKKKPTTSSLENSSMYTFMLFCCCRFSPFTSSCVLVWLIFGSAKNTAFLAKQTPELVASLAAATRVSHWEACQNTFSESARFTQSIICGNAADRWEISGCFCCEHDIVGVENLLSARYNWLAFFLGGKHG